MHIRPYEKLIVWKEAYSLCLAVYRYTLAFPSYERFGLSSQIRRASSSIPLNIAEGNSKRSYADKVRFLDIAAASLEEVHCIARLGKDLEYLDERQFCSIDRRIHRVSYLLMKLRAAFAT